MYRYSLRCGIGFIVDVVVGSGGDDSRDGAGQTPPVPSPFEAAVLPVCIIHLAFCVYYTKSVVAIS